MHRDHRFYLVSPLNKDMSGIKYIDGDTRLVHVSAMQMAKQFCDELHGRYQGDAILKTSPFCWYFTDSNVEYICSTIAKTLGHLFPGENFVVPANGELADVMVATAISNLGLAGGGKDMLAHLNKEVIEHEARVQFSSMRNKLLYHKWILENDRAKTLPYGEYTRSTKGEVTISTTNYSLSHPWANHRRSYMEVSEGMEYCPSKKTYTRIPNYLLPTVPKPGE